MGLFDGLRAEIADKKKPQSMRLLCGEMSNQEMRTAQALVNWFLRMCDRYEPQNEVTEGLDPDLARIIAQKCVNRARQSHPDAAASAALRSVEMEIASMFTPEAVQSYVESAQRRPERATAPNNG
jgi:hypothetical protein